MSGGEKLGALGSNWPNYGFDEWFLKMAVCSRIVLSGVLTFISWNERRLNLWFALDIVYATWANSKSEILHYEPAPVPEAIPLADDLLQEIQRLPLAVVD